MARCRLGQAITGGIMVGSVILACIFPVLAPAAGWILLVRLIPFPWQITYVAQGGFLTLAGAEIAYQVKKAQLNGKLVSTPLYSSWYLITVL